MMIRRAAIQGVRGVMRAPYLLLALWLCNLLFAVPFALQIGLSLKESIGPSLVHESLTRGFDMGWYGEYQAGANGIETSFRPTITGATAFYDNLEDWLTGRIFAHYPVLVAAAALYGLLWLFLLGGVLDRFARPAESAVRARFAQACGLYFFRLLRLAVLGLVLYFGIYKLQQWLLGRVEGFTRDATREWTVLLWTLAVYLLTALLVVAVHMVLGFAKVATVAENQRSVLAATLRGARFAAAHPLPALGLYFGVLAVGGVMLGIYAAVAPGTTQAGPFAIGVAFVVGQIFLLAKLFVRLTLLGGQTALFQSLSPR